MHGLHSLSFVDTKNTMGHEFSSFITHLHGTASSIIKRLIFYGTFKYRERLPDTFYGLIISSSPVSVNAFASYIF